MFLDEVPLMRDFIDSATRELTSVINRIIEHMNHWFLYKSADAGFCIP